MNNNKDKTIDVKKENNFPENLVKTNHEFLFLYDAKICNPNGDPDNENKPRMDEEREINLVSDVRLKRYIRDYLSLFKKSIKNEEFDIYSSKVDNKTLTATDRIKQLLLKYHRNTNFSDNYKSLFTAVVKSKKEKKDEKESSSENELDVKIDGLESQIYGLLEDFLIEKLIDIRLFGATIPIKSKDKGSSITKTGPIQLNWGYSLNNVKLCDSNGITSHLSSEATKSQGAMGKDNRVCYSFIAFYGNIIAKKAEHTLLTDDDIKLFDEALIKSIPLLATRSKIGQYPRFYVRCEYNSSEYLYGDLRKLVKLELNEEAAKNDASLKINTIRDISEVTLNVNDLHIWLQNMKNENKIKDIAFWMSQDLSLKETWDVKINRNY